MEEKYVNGVGPQLAQAAFQTLHSILRSEQAGLHHFRSALASSPQKIREGSEKLLR